MTFKFFISAVITDTALCYCYLLILPHTSLLCLWRITYFASVRFSHNDLFIFCSLLSALMSNIYETGKHHVSKNFVYHLVIYVFSRTPILGFTSSKISELEHKKISTEEHIAIPSDWDAYKYSDYGYIFDKIGYKTTRGTTTGVPSVEHDSSSSSSYSWLDKYPDVYRCNWEEDFKQLIEQEKQHDSFDRLFTCSG